MAVYFIVEIATAAGNKKDYAKYIGKVRPVVEKYKGKYLARGGKVTAVFGNWDPERMILIEFPSSEDVRQWLNSPEYLAIAPLRENSVSTRAVMIEGCGDDC
ncbi:MAG: DUF1330 domain-containing protein [Candidatus Omnitrophota bacterium]